MMSVKSYLKSRLLFLMGRLITLTHPKTRQEVLEADIRGPKRKLKKWIARTEFRRLAANGDGVTVENALTRRWTTDNLAPDYYDTYADRFDDMFRGSHAQILDWLKEYATQTEINSVIEIGCGDGQALAAMAEHVPEIAKWTGIDINADIIARNTERFQKRRELTFAAADATDWLSEHFGPGTLLVSYGGVMEYFAPETLRKWFELIARRDGAGVLLVEPIDPSHDTAMDPASHIWGWENSFSHNHLALLEQSGYRIIHSARAEAAKFQWSLILAAPDQLPLRQGSAPQPSDTTLVHPKGVGDGD